MNTPYHILSGDCCNTFLKFIVPGKVSLCCMPNRHTICKTRSEPPNEYFQSLSTHKVQKYHKSPRLVGIELNPGPKGFPGSLVKTIAKAIKNEVKTEVIQPLKSVRNVIATKKKRKSKNNKNINSNSNNSHNTSSFSHPIRSPFNSLLRRTVTVPFHDQVIEVLSHTATAGGNCALDFRDGVYTSTYGGLTLNPTSIEGFPASSGFVIAKMASIYQEFRYKALRYRFVPTFGGMYNGTVVLGIKEDPLTGYPTSAIATSSCSLSESCHITNTMTLDATKLVTQLSQIPWYLTKQTQHFGPDLRLCAPGVLVGYLNAYTNVFANNNSVPMGTLIGYVVAEGTIEFSGLVSDVGFTSTSSEIKELDITESKNHDCDPSPSISPIESEKFIMPTLQRYEHNLPVNINSQPSSSSAGYFGGMIRKT